MVDRIIVLLLIIIDHRMIEPGNGPRLVRYVFIGYTLAIPILIQVDIPGEVLFDLIVARLLKLVLKVQIGVLLVVHFFDFEALAALSEVI